MLEGLKVASHLASWLPSLSDEQKLEPGTVKRLESMKLPATQPACAQLSPFIHMIDDGLLIGNRDLY
jgi:hypothetical protein